MTYLILRDDPIVVEQIPRFQAILTAYGITIEECIFNESDKTVKLSTDARSLINTQAVHAAAYDCFGDAIISYRTTYYN